MSGERISGDAELMDSLLDRLTMKARGTLASVRPVIQTRPAAIPMESRETGMQFEQFSESSTLHRESTLETPTHENKKTVTAAPQRLAQTQVDPAQKSSIRSAAEPEQPVLRSGHTGAKRAVEEVIGAMLPKQPSVHVSPNDTDGWRLRSLPKEGTVTPKEGAAVSGQEAHIRDTAVPAHSRSLASPQDQPPEQRATREQRQERAETKQQAERGSEIRISIGTIELRAPRAENKPAAPAFRPRVSLDDFLHRKPEGKA